MQKSQEVIGLSIVHFNTGKKLGAVGDVLFDDRQSFCGLLMEDGGWLRRRRYIPKENIRAIGRDAVVIDDEAQILPLDEKSKQWIGICSGQKKLKGLPVLLSSGYELGVIENVYFMEEMGTLVGYELSDGLFSDLMDGRKILKPTHPLIWGHDVLVAETDHVQVETRERRRK